MSLTGPAMHVNVLPPKTLVAVGTAVVQRQLEQQPGCGAGP